jgi:peptidoglycan-associated lipoprotein
MTRHIRLLVILTAIAACAATCGGKKPPVANVPPSTPSAFPGAVSEANPRPPGPPPEPSGIESNAPVASTPLLPWNDKSIDAINGPDSPLKPVLFAYNSDELDEAAQQVLKANADVLKTYGTWVVTVEGHCDERGTAEYNLALGDRRALAAKNYLMSLGIAADRIRTVSYGKEFPFDPGHDETAWTHNRRAHFMLTSK